VPSTGEVAGDVTNMLTYYEGKQFDYFNDDTSRNNICQQSWWTRSLSTKSGYNYYYVGDTGDDYLSANAKTMTMNVVAAFVVGDRIMQNYTWKELQSIAQMKLSESTLATQYNIHLGDKKSDVYHSYILVDLGLEQDDYDGFVFMDKSFYTSNYTDTGTTVGGYIDSTIATEVENIYSSLIYYDLKQVIKKVSIKCNDAPSNYTETHTGEYHMFLPAHREMGGQGYTSDSPYAPKIYGEYLDKEGNCFDYFENQENLSDIIYINNVMCRTVSPQYETSAAHISFTDHRHVWLSIEGDSQIAPCFVVG
jgi:hypothetical protein